MHARRQPQTSEDLAGLHPEREVPEPPIVGASFETDEERFDEVFTRRPCA